MFSEWYIERTKERLVEYVKDNRYPFARKYDDGRGGYWEITAEGLSAKPIEDAIEVFGETGTVDIITETLNNIHGVSGGASYQSVNPEETTEFTTDEYEVYRSADNPSLLYEWFTPTEVKSDKETMKSNVESEDENEEVSDKEMVNHPPHYNQGKFETIDIIEDIVAGYDDPVEAYLVGTTLKYLARAPFKNAKKQDLEKAEFYLKRAIDRQQ